jgi:hypothetical protein
MTSKLFQMVEGYKYTTAYIIVVITLNAVLNILLLWGN